MRRSKQNKKSLTMRLEKINKKIEGKLRRYRDRGEQYKKKSGLKKLSARTV